MTRLSRAFLSIKLIVAIITILFRSFHCREVNVIVILPEVLRSVDDDNNNNATLPLQTVYMESFDRLGRMYPNIRSNVTCSLLQARFGSPSYGTEEDAMAAMIEELLRIVTATSNDALIVLAIAGTRRIYIPPILNTSVIVLWGTLIFSERPRKQYVLWRRFRINWFQKMVISDFRKTPYYNI